MGRCRVLIIAPGTSFSMKEKSSRRAPEAMSRRHSPPRPFDRLRLRRDRSSCAWFNSGRGYMRMVLAAWRSHQSLQDTGHQAMQLRLDMLPDLLAQGVRNGACHFNRFAGMTLKALACNGSYRATPPHVHGSNRARDIVWIGLG